MIKTKHYNIIQLQVYYYYVSCDIIAINSICFFTFQDIIIIESVRETPPLQCFIYYKFIIGQIIFVRSKNVSTQYVAICVHILWYIMYRCVYSYHSKYFLIYNKLYYFQLIYLLYCALLNSYRVLLRLKMCFFHTVIYKQLTLYYLITQFVVELYIELNIINNHIRIIAKVKKILK